METDRDWNPLDDLRKRRKLWKLTGLIVSRTSICATIVLRIVSIRFSVEQAVGWSSARNVRTRKSPSCSICLNQSS